MTFDNQGSFLHKCGVSHVPKSRMGDRDPLILSLDTVLPLFVLAMTVNLKCLQESVQSSLFAQSCLTLCHPIMDCSMPGLPVHHQLQEFTFKLMSIESVMPSNQLILCSPLLLLPSIFPNIRVFSNESALFIRWPKYCSFSFNISPSNKHSGQISFRMNWLELLSVQELSRVFSNTTVQKHQFFGAQLSL